MATRNSPKPRPGTPIENRNFLSPVGFKFTLRRAPGVAFFCNEANIPDMTLGEAIQPTYLRDIPTPGDKIQFGDLSLRFLVDEDLTNYMEIQTGFVDWDFQKIQKNLMSWKIEVFLQMDMHLAILEMMEMISIQMELFKF